MFDKSYDMELVKRSKIESSDNPIEDSKETMQIHLYEKGDKVKLLDENDLGTIYRPADKFNNVNVLYNNKFIEVNVKKIEPYLSAKELYPDGYDLDSLFIDFKVANRGSVNPTALAGN